MSGQIVDILTADIRNGIYHEGDALPSERHMVEQFGVSRITVREALAELERSGLVVQHPGARTKVRLPDSASMVELLSSAASLHLARPGGVRYFQEVRTLVETGVTQMAAEKTSHDRVADLRAALADNEDSLGDVARFAATDIAFHAAICAILDNPILSGFYLAFDRWLSELRRKTLAVEGQMQTAFEAHVAIFRAIEARDPATAQDAMRGHLVQVNRVYEGL